MTKYRGFLVMFGSWFVAAMAAAVTLHFLRVYLPPVPVVYEIRYVVCRVTAGEPDCETIKQEPLDAQEK